MRDIFEKVYIRSEADLPKEAGRFVVCKQSGEIFRDYIYPKFDDKFPDANMWLKYINWYLRPIKDESQRDELIKLAQQFYADEETCIHNIDNYLKEKHNTKEK